MTPFVLKLLDFTKTLLIAGFIAFFCIRGFLFEPFKIPSSSMMPNLLVGDFLFVSKFAYGNRLPLTDWFFWQGEPERGDIVVFKRKGSGLPGSFFGLGETLFVKRLVGLPGDRIAFKNKQLIINGVPLLQTGQHPYTLDDGREVLAAHENLLGIGHTILQDPAREGQDVAEVVVPPDHFVMMGDNRDNSIDGRFWSWPAWGFVPRADLMGRAEFIFWSWNDAWQPRLERFGTSLRAQPQAGTESSQPTPTAPPQVLNQARGGMAG